MEDVGGAFFLDALDSLLEVDEDDLDRLFLSGDLLLEDEEDEEPLVLRCRTLIGGFLGDLDLHRLGEKLRLR